MVVMAYLLGPGREAVEDEPGAVHEPHRVHRALLALRRPGVDLPVPGVVSVVGRPVAACRWRRDAFRSGSHQEERPHLHDGRRGAVRVHRSSRSRSTRSISRCRWPSRVALIIATIKGSMVASVFMHLSHEKKWIYGALMLTVVVLHRPDDACRSSRSTDTIGTPMHAPAAHGRGARGALTCRCRAFHLFFIGAVGRPGGVLSRRGRSGSIALEHDGGLRRDRASASLARGGGLAVYGAAFQRKTRNL